MSWLNNDKGAALLTVMAVVIIVFFTSTALLQLGATEWRISKNHADQTKALYIADAGISMFMARMKVSNNLKGWPEGWENDFINMPVGDGYIESFVMTDEGTTFTVTSTGVLAKPDGSVDARKSVQIKILKPPYDSAFAGAVGSAQGTAVGNTLKITGNSDITGNFTYKGDVDIGTASVTVNGTITTAGNVLNSGTINGNVIAGGYIENDGAINAGDDGLVQAGGYLSNNDSISTGTGGVVHTDSNLMNNGVIYSDYFYSGDLTGNQPNGSRLYNRAKTEVLVPDVPPVDYDWYLDNADVVHNDAVTFSSTDLKDLPGDGVMPYIIYVKGDVLLDNLNIGTGRNYSGVGMIVAEGNINIKTDLMPDDPNYSSLGLISKSDMSVGGNYNIGGIFICEGTFRTSGDVNIYGSLVPHVIDVNGHLNIDYTASAKDLLGSGLPGNEYQVKVWKEQYPVF